MRNFTVCPISGGPGLMKSVRIRVKVSFSVSFRRYWSRNVGFAVYLFIRLNSNCSVEPYLQTFLKFIFLLRFETTGVKHLSTPQTFCENTPFLTLLMVSLKTLF